MQLLSGNTCLGMVIRHYAQCNSLGVQARVRVIDPLTRTCTTLHYYNNELTKTGTLG